MTTLNAPRTEKLFRRFFYIGLIVKGVYAVLEFFAGLFLFIISPDKLGNWVIGMALKELAEDRGGTIAHVLLSSAQQLQNSPRWFIAFYLASHALVKIVIIIGLLKKILWFYPAALVVFTAFGVYQIQRYTHTHSPVLLWFTVLDAVIIWLTWHEYKFYKSQINDR